jgi:hypothetical protein
VFRGYQKHQYEAIIPVNAAAICKITVRLVVKPIFLVFSSIDKSVSYKSEVVSSVSMSQENNENRQGQGQQQQQSPSQWSQMIRQVLESVTGKNMSTTINFQNLEIDIPKAQGPDGRDLGSAKWTVNGKVVWTNELHKTGERS